VRALVADLVYGTPASTRDPAHFAFAHGSKRLPVEGAAERGP
jgi:hypothetical protein